MLYLGFRLGLGERKNFLATDDFHSIFCYEPVGQPIITPHKHLCVELTWSNSWAIELRFDLTFRGRDHAGLDIDVQVLGLSFGFQIYDSRHWNYDEDRWYQYGEEDAEESDAPPETK